MPAEERAAFDAWRADQILSTGREVRALHLTFTFDASTVITGFAIGLAISIVTIVASSTTLPSRMNITSVRMCSISSTWCVVMMMLK